MSSIEKYYNELLHNWQHFIATGEILPSVKPYIAEAWKKCKENNLSPYGPGKLDIVTKAQYLKCMKANEDLVKATAPVIKKLFSHIPFVDIICITDKDGLILDMYGTTESLQLSRQENNFITGSYWNESLIGINIANDSVKLDKTLSIIGAENFLKVFHDTGSVTSPIHSDENTILGCLCVVFSTNKITHLSTIRHLEQIASMASYAIEREIALIIASKITDKAFESINEGILITDCNLTITRMNSSTESILGFDNIEMGKTKLTSIFPQYKSMLNIISSEKTYSGEMTFQINGKIISCNGSAYELTFKNQKEGYILVFNRIQSYNKSVNKTVGNIAHYNFSDIITINPKMLSVVENAKRIADTDCNVLILGDSGTGKEMLAQSIHSASDRASEPLVIVNCAALPRDLVESELFGYEKGAFTGASSTGMPGKFELADGGTLFLDEIGELPLEIQPKLLRAIETHKITRIGGKYEKDINVRLISATNRNLSKEIAQNKFRLDLFYRINVVSLQIPPLKERPEDIPLLADYFINKLNQNNDTNKYLSNSFLNQLRNVSIPGNVRQLENIITQSYYLLPGTINCINSLPNYLHDDMEMMELSSPKSMQSIERESILLALRKHGGNVSYAAQELNIGRTTIYRKIEQYKITKAEIKGL